MASTRDAVATFATTSSSFLLLLLFASSPAFAQEAEAEVQAEGEAEESEADPEEEARFAEARDRFRQGVALARAGNCRGALAELQASLEILPRPNTLYNIATCQEELHRYDLAVDAYAAYLEMASEDEPDRPAVEATMRTLRMLLGTIHIETNTAAEVWLDDRVVGEAPGDVLVPGGSHVIELRAEGHLPERREVQVAAQRTVSLEVTLSTAEENVVFNTTIERPPIPAPVFWGGVALTFVTAAIGAYFGVQALQIRETELSRDPRLPPNLDAIEESAIIADAFFIGATIFGAATVVLAFLTDFGGEPETEQDEPEGARVRPLLGPAYAGLEVQW
ncbi:MAG: PEGA domain-containing protein [Sandaracinaceae bacterium]|nr:MAG: PEGA domain-containing protein [Sandaracinaceae bacterium]